MTWSIRLSVGLSIGWLVSKNFLKERKVSLPCSYRSPWCIMKLLYFWSGSIPLGKAEPNFGSLVFYSPDPGKKPDLDPGSRLFTYIHLHMYSMKICNKKCLAFQFLVMVFSHIFQGISFSRKTLVLSEFRNPDAKTGRTRNVLQKRIRILAKSADPTGLKPWLKQKYLCII